MEEAMFTVSVVGSFDLKDGNINFKAANIVNRQQPSHGAARDRSQEYGGEHPRGSGDDGRERLGQAAVDQRAHAAALNSVDRSGKNGSRGQSALRWICHELLRVILLIASLPAHQYGML